MHAILCILNLWVKNQIEYFFLQHGHLCDSFAKLSESGQPQHFQIQDPSLLSGDSHQCCRSNCGWQRSHKTKISYHCIKCLIQQNCYGQRVVSLNEGMKVHRQFLSIYFPVQSSLECAIYKHDKVEQSNPYTLYISTCLQS